MDEHLTECPQCGGELNPPLKSGRQVCSNCGWANRQKEVVSAFSEEWNDIVSRASESNRLNVQPNISELQNIKRKVSESTDFFPKHSSYLK
jgi:protein-arginine kinase activator protein McsA